MIYFTADLHLDHKHVLNFCDRPYQTVSEMSEDIVQDIESTLKPGDILYILGDVQFCTHGRYLKRITGIRNTEVHLVAGNHDSKKVRRFKGWRSVSSIKNIKIDGVKITLCHYPIESWMCKDRGSLHFHGHTHNNASHSLSYMPNRIDVGYDKTRRALTSYQEVRQLIMKDKLIKEAHGSQ